MALGQSPILFKGFIWFLFPQQIHSVEINTTHDEKDTIVSAFSSILLGCFCPSPQQEVPRLRALHPQVPVQRQTSQEKANSTGKTAAFQAG